MNWWKQFKPKSCILNLRAASKADTLSEIVDHLVEAELLSADLAPAALRALLERENLASTGVGQNVAIPHVKLPGIERALCALAIHREGVSWAAIDGAPVHILFAVLRPEKGGTDHDPERHLELMRWVSKLARDPDFRRFALKARTKTELIDLLKEMSAV
jgi:mannitol/fructose-specific phosphotransferase system IIA component (Ntr-type)